MAESLLVTVFLGCGSVWDLKKKSVPVVYLYLGGIIAICFNILKCILIKDVQIWPGVVYSVIPGMVSLFLSYVSKEQIGFGDGWIVIIIGLIMGLKKVMSVLLAALICLTIYGMFLLIIKKAKGKTRIPFVPFLLIGNIIFLNL